MHLQLKVAKHWHAGTTSGKIMTFLISLMHSDGYLRKWLSSLLSIGEKAEKPGRGNLL
jgi:hypothetical protein